ncbi:hypothetical protein [Paraburkholderia sediminicola]|uniref:hypothetical protein n=1 Tax=Paraburkholderia sediminicola TaxID=458836 RepID=UPI0038BCCD3D
MTDKGKVAPVALKSKTGKNQKMKPVDAVQAAEATIQKAIELILARHSEIDQAEAQSFVLQQFEFMNADANEVISAERIVQRYEAAIVHRIAGDSEIRDKLAKLIFRGLSGRPSHQSLQYFELQHAFQLATGKSLSQYAEDVVAIVNQLQEMGYIRWTKPGHRMPLIFQGIDFDEWSAKMKVEKDAASSVTYNVTGSNARINHQSTDMSTNVVLERSGIQDQLDALRRTIAATQLSGPERQSALDVVDAVDAQFASGAPKKSVVTALLGALPKIADIATIVGTVAAFVK